MCRNLDRGNGSAQSWAGMALPLWFALLSSCTAPGYGRGEDWVVERTNADGVEVVRTLSGSVWSAPRELVEELVIGVLDGEDAYMFGRIDQVAPDGNGGAYVFDGRAPALRHFDGNGRHTRTLGRQGAGPGEYGEYGDGLAVLADGKILLRDRRNARFNLYDRDGAPVGHWPLVNGLSTPRAMYVDTAGRVYSRILTGPPQPGMAWPIGLLRLSSSGAVLDTIPSPPFPDEPIGGTGTFAPSKFWELHPEGYIVVGVSDRYAIELRKSEGTIRIEKEGQRIAVHPEERVEREAERERLIRTMGPALMAEPAAIPSVKPFFQGVYAAEDGTIWVHLHTDAIRQDPPADAAEPAPNAPPATLWREPVVFDVFDAEGTYFGEVRVPSGITLRTYSRSEVWGTRTGEFGELYLVRMRVSEAS